MLTLLHCCVRHALRHNADRNQHWRAPSCWRRNRSVGAAAAVHVEPAAGCVCVGAPVFERSCCRLAVTRCRISSTVYLSIVHRAAQSFLDRRTVRTLPSLHSVSYSCLFPFDFVFQTKCDSILGQSIRHLVPFRTFERFYCRGISHSFVRNFVRRFCDWLSKVR